MVSTDKIRKILLKKHKTGGAVWYSPDRFIFASIRFSIVPLFSTVTLVALVTVIIVLH